MKIDTHTRDQALAAALAHWDSEVTEVVEAIRRQLGGELRGDRFVGVIAALETRSEQIEDDALVNLCAMALLRLSEVS
jgi:hypothetical protein